MKTTHGVRTNAIVELVDIYKTVCELAGVPLPEDDTYEVEGTSLIPLLQDPSGKGWNKTTGLTQYPRCPRIENPRQDWKDNACIHSTERGDFGANFRLVFRMYKQATYRVWLILQVIWDTL